jgi:hypothetical protein
MRPARSRDGFAARTRATFPANAAVSTMRKTAKSLLIPTIAYKRDTGISRAVSSVSTKSEYVARSQRKRNSHCREK